jgi:hypothetical protein
MKKRLLLSALAAIALLAGATQNATAQNNNIDALADKYVDREGFIVVNLSGEMLRGMSSVLADSDSKIGINDNTKVEIGELLEEVVSLTVIIMHKGTDEAFMSDIQNAVDAVKYSPIASINEDNMSIKVLSSKIKRGEFRNNDEIVVTVSDDEATLLCRVIGTVDTKRLTRLVKEMKK